MGDYSNFFGKNREAVIQRDNEQCVHCGVTRLQHFEKYGRDITVDHIDGKGRNAPKSEKNNNLNNLQTLCLSCHGKKDIQRRLIHGKTKLTVEDMLTVRGLLAQGVTQESIAKRFNVTQPLISYIKRGYRGV